MYDSLNSAVHAALQLKSFVALPFRLYWRSPTECALQENRQRATVAPAGEEQVKKLS
jgi:hypothetical protein